ncbi:MAG: hypothetical protein RMH75_05805 [Archaeoglobaceae archaeon]|nr:hypothetical protein [Archaeoglobaceae archaeon]MDW7990159.1 hypothetical protein [Archaeoglobaceae archaeon]
MKILIFLVLIIVFLGCVEERKTQTTPTPDLTPVPTPSKIAITNLNVTKEIENLEKEFQELEMLISELESLENISFEP